MMDENGEMIEFGTFKSDVTRDVYDRAGQIADFFASKCIEHDISSVNIEGLAFGIRGDATRDLAGLLFTIVTTLRRKTTNIPVAVITPTSLKKFATGSGKSDKVTMITAVPDVVMNVFLKAKYKKTTGLYDVVDAYWLASYKTTQTVEH